MLCNRSSSRSRSRDIVFREGCATIVPSPQPYHRVLFLFLLKYGPFEFMPTTARKAREVSCHFMTSLSGNSLSFFSWARLQETLRSVFMPAREKERGLSGSGLCLFFNSPGNSYPRSSPFSPPHFTPFLSFYPSFLPVHSFRFSYPCVYNSSFITKKSKPQGRASAL